MRVAYPQYTPRVTPEMMAEVRQTATRLLAEVGFVVEHERFLDHLRGRPGLRFGGQRVYFDPALSNEYLDRHVADLRRSLLAGDRAAGAATQGEELALAASGSTRQDWTLAIAGYSMALLDPRTDEVREATCDDLRDCIKLARSFGIGGMYPLMPQDVPPLLRTLACFRVCWESADNIEPYDYQQPEQVPFLLDMHRLMGKPMDITFTVPTAMTLDARDLDIFLSVYPLWNGTPDTPVGRGAPERPTGVSGVPFNWRILDYGMLGITKPCSALGCATMQLAESLAVHMLLKLFDDTVEAPLIMTAGQPTDLRHVCWAFGSPRRHVFSHVNSWLAPALCGLEPEEYVVAGVLLETASAATDEQAALEKMASGLLGALQGARHFGYAGVLCVDDLFSPTQFVIDVEMVAYLRELIEAFDPPPDLLALDGLYDECREVGLGLDTFLSHPHTARRCRNVMPSSDRLVREKLRSCLAHHRTLKDRARDEALERIAACPEFVLDEARREGLARIYAEAEKALGGAGY
ncbi:trimethylamine methyltransferase family protein [bacterium]|nr:trimethylamine methyltransferase family protein [bacterium]